MSVFGRYLCYRLKNSTLRTIFLTLLAIVFTINVVDGCTSYDYDEYKSTGIYILAVILGTLCTLIPMLELSGFKNRRNLDTLYFFPISRVKMALVHYLSGFLQVLAVYSVGFFTAWIFLAVKTDVFTLGYLLPYYFLSIILGIVMYSVVMFIFMQANSVVDGVLFVVLWMFALGLVLWVVSIYIAPMIDKFHPHLYSVNYESWGILYTPINNLTVIFEDLIETNRDSNDYTARMAQKYCEQAYMFFIWGGIGIASAIGYFLSFAKKSAHEAGDISTSVWGYKLLIPLYGYSLLMCIGEINIVSIVIIAMMLVGYIIYRRGIRIHRNDIIFTVLSIIPIILAHTLD